MASTGLLESFLGALQASLSVLLVMFYGGTAAYLGLIDRPGTKPISKICVRIFLPALLITKVGAELQLGSANRYLVIVIWGIVCHVVSFLIGLFAHRGLGMADWTTVAILINNTTSYPLLLITALEDTGILRSLVGADETTEDAIARAQSYFLVFSTISNCITFAVGPRLIDSEHEPEQEEGKADDASHADGPNAAHTPDVEADEHTRLLRPGPRPISSSFPSRTNSFLLSRPRNQRPKPQLKEDRRRPWFVSPKKWDRLSPSAKWWFLFIVDFFNAPLVGAILGAVIGLTPALHHAFFSNSSDGGIFTAWLTASLKRVGGLFVTLPVVVAGVSLFCSVKEAKQHHESAVDMPWGTVSFILVVRFIVWPAMSIPVIYLLASKTTLLGSDPMLWFTLMMMPTGPPAMKLITLVQVADGTKEDESIISKLLTVRQPFLSVGLKTN